MRIQANRLVVVFGLCLLGAAGPVRAQERASVPRLETQARAELARAGQPPVFTVARAYQVDRHARATMRRLKLVARLEAQRAAFAYMVARGHAEANRRRFNATNEHLRAEHQRLTNELRRLRN